MNGQWLFEVLSGKVLECVLKYKKMKKEETSLSILVNNLTDNMLENIKVLIL